MSKKKVPKKGQGEGRGREGGVPAPPAPLTSETFLALAEEIFSPVDFQATLTKIAEGAARVLGADASAILLPEEETGELVIKGSHNLSASYVRAVRIKVGVDPTGQAIIDKKPQIMEDSPAYFRKIGDAFTLKMIEREGIMTRVAVPIFVGLEAVGTLNLYHFRLHRYSGEELKRTELFCRMTGVAIQTARRLKVQSEKIGSLDVLNETSQRIFQAADEEEACRVVIQAAFRFIPCWRASALLVDEEKGCIEIKYGLEEWGEKPVEPFRVMLEDITDEARTGVKGFQEPFQCGDLPQEYPVLLPFIGRKDLRSFASVPVAREGRLLGVIVVSHREPNQFRLEQLEPLRTIGNLLSLALERLELVKKMRARQKEIESALSFQTHLNTELLTLQQLSAALVSSLELKEILTMVVEGAKASLGFRKVLISLLDPSEKFLERKAWTGIPEEVAAQMVTQRPPVEYIRRYFHDRFRISRSYFIGHNEAQGVVEAEYSYVDRSRPTNLLSEDAWHPEDLLITPLHARDGKLIGIMSVDDPGDGKIPSRRKILSLEMFANAAAAALENSRAYDEERARVRELAGIQSIGTTITAVLRLDELIGEVVRTIQETFHYYRVGILLVEKEKLVLKSTSGAATEAVRGLAIDMGAGGVTSWVAQSGEACLNRDVTQEPRYLAVDPKTRCEVAVPLALKGQVIGVLNVEEDEVGKLDEVDKRLLSTLAPQIAVAIENARLYEEAQRRIDELSVLYKVGQSMSSVLNLDELLSKVLQILSETFHYSKSTISLLEEEGKVAVCRAVFGFGEQNLGIRFRVGVDGITGWVASTGLPLIVPDVSQESRYVAFAENIGSEIALPLKVRDQVIGVMNVEEERLNAFGEDDLRLLSTLAAQIAVAIENARLYEEKEKQAITDEKTGLFNYRHFQKALRDELRRANRYNHTLSLLMLDVDHFKHYNDRWGHPRGDEVLALLAQIMRENIRDVDVPVRYGGEEFMVVLPETGKTEAAGMGERIRKAVREHDFIYGEEQPEGRLTVSIGVATFPEDAQEAEAIVDRVDQAMYRAKSKGRDNVQAF